MVDPEWLGRRVVIRHAVDRDVSGRLRFSDALGDLVELDAHAATVETRTGPVRIPTAHVAVAKLVEPSAAQILALATVCARGWRAADTAEVGGWLLRANGGFTHRANTALPLHRPTPSLSATLSAARDWYRARGLPLRVQLLSRSRWLLDDGLAERGWAAGPACHVMTARLDMLDKSAAPEVRVVAVPDDDWLARFRDGTPPPDLARDLLVRHDRAGFAEIRRDGRTVAIGRGAVDDGWLGVTAVEVDPAHRRQGLAVAVMRALWRWGTERHGAVRSYLEVAVENAPALTLYRRLGYRPHHDYWYRAEPPEPPVNPVG